jgi:hypothetical protein
MAGPERAAILGGKRRSVVRLVESVYTCGSAKFFLNKKVIKVID